MVTLVVYIGDTVYLLLFHQLCNVLYHLALVDHVGNLGDYYHLPSGGLNLNLGLGAYHYTTAAGLESIPYTGQSLDDASCREVRSFDVMHQLINRNVVVVNISTDSISYLRQIMGSHVGGHTYSDTG